MRYLLLTLCLLVAFGARSQNAPDPYDNEVFVPNIKTVQFNLKGLQNSFPIYELGKPARLQLSFDDLDADSKYYTYTFIHCDRNWQPTDLMFQEYVRGFEHEQILDFENSIGTRIPYTHYNLVFPNRNTEITKSGNYMIVILEQSDWDRPILMRRFVVIEPPEVSIDIIRAQPGDVAKVNTHQEIRYQINTQDLQVRDPKNEISCTILQNGRWDNAIYDVRSRFENGTMLVFNYMDKIVFPAGKDFRSVDLRSTKYLGEGVFSLENVEGHVRAVVKLDKPRTFSPYFTKIDLNGQFVIATTDYPDVQYPDLRADYVETVFTLETGREYDEEVFVFGGLTEWQLQERFRLRYEPEFESYVGAGFVKQGFYDYIYVLANADGTPDESTLEGNWYEATNDYTLIVYYRPFGSRYDRAIAATTFEWGL